MTNEAPSSVSLQNVPDLVSGDDTKRGRRQSRDGKVVCVNHCGVTSNPNARPACLPKGDRPPQPYGARDLLDR